MTFRTSSPPSAAAATVELDDEQLLAGLPRNPGGFSVLYRRYLTRVYRYVFARVGSHGDAEDLTSQVFLAALEALPRYRNNGCFAAWLFSVARRKVADHYRRAGRQNALDPHPDLPGPADDLLAEIGREEDLRRLSVLVRDLDDDERELIRLRFAARLEFAEIAVLLGRKPSAVKMSLYRLLERLHHQLEVNDGA